MTDKPVEDLVRALGFGLLRVKLDPESPLYQHAHKHGLGAPLSNESVESLGPDEAGTLDLAMGPFAIRYAFYAGGICMYPVGHPDKVVHVLW